MRNAALVLGIIGGIIGMIVGFFSFGYVEFINWFGEIEDLAHQVDNAALIQAVSLFSPLLAIAGGAMSRSQAMVGGALMLVSAAGMYWAFGFRRVHHVPDCDVRAGRGSGAGRASAGRGLTRRQYTV